MKSGVDNVINIPTSLKGKFFKYWFKFLLPFHGLTDREMDVAAAFLLKRHELSKVISCLLYTSPSPRDRTRSRMPSSA